MSSRGKKSIIWSLDDEFLRCNVKLPKRWRIGSAGYDLEVLTPVTLRPGEQVALDTGLRLELPEGYYCQLSVRSNFALVGIIVLGGIIGASMIILTPKLDFI